MKKKINLGCGPHAIPGWINIDIEHHVGVVQQDLSKPLSWGSNEFDFAFSEHFFEHLTREQGLKLLKEVRRILKPGGVLRLSTPNLETLVLDYYHRKIDRWAASWAPKTRCALVNEGMRLWGHQYLYDSDELSLIFREAGFKTPDFKQHRISGFSELSNLEIRPYHEDLIVEAVK